MPLPVGHSLMGYALSQTTPMRRDGSGWKTILLFVVVANLPDLDFALGFLNGTPNQYHRHFVSHSFGMSLLVGMLFGLYYKYVRGKTFWNYFCIFTTVYFSHVALDYLSVDTSQPFGVPMLWPFSETYFMSPMPVFLAVEKGGGNLAFLQSLFVMHNLMAAFWEFTIFLPLLTLIKVWQYRRRLFTFLRDKSVRLEVGR